MNTKVCQRCIYYLREFQIGLPNIRYGSGKIDYIIEVFEHEILNNMKHKRKVK